jgi:ankyrin repeat protein
MRVFNKMSADFVNYLVNHKKGNLLTGFMETVIEDNNIEMFKYLLEQGVHPTPFLIKVAEHGNVEQCELLLKAGANVNTNDLFVNTALHRAVERRLVSIVELLLRYNIDVSIKNNLLTGYTDKSLRISNGKTAKDIALEKGFQEIADLISLHEINSRHLVTG